MYFIILSTLLSMIFKNGKINASCPKNGIRKSIKRKKHIFETENPGGLGATFTLLLKTSFCQFPVQKMAEQ